MGQATPRDGMRVYKTWQVSPADLDQLLNATVANGGIVEFVTPVADANGNVTKFVVTCLVKNSPGRAVRRATI